MLKDAYASLSMLAYDSTMRMRTQLCVCIVEPRLGQNLVFVCFNNFLHVI